MRPKVAALARRRRQAEIDPAIGSLRGEAGRLRIAGPTYDPAKGIHRNRPHCIRQSATSPPDVHATWIEASTVNSKTS